MLGKYFFKKFGKRTLCHKYIDDRVGIIVEKTTPHTPVDSYICTINA